MAYYRTVDPDGVPILMHKGIPYALERLDPETPLSVAAAMTTATSHQRVISRYVKDFQIDTYAPTVKWTPLSRQKTDFS